MTNHGIDAALRASFEDDHRRGNLDGSLAATKLPLSALDHLVAGQFDVVRWLTPWRQYWLHALSQPQYVHSVPSWLPELAGYLGSHVAPRGSTNSTFTPTAAYLTGFCAGMRNTWNKAVAARVLPPDRSTLTHWMTQPANWLKAGAYLADATICDMTMAQKRAKRAALTRTALRVVLWVTTGAFLLMEIAAIAVTIQGSWTESDGTVAKSQTANAIGANLCFSIALIALCALVIVDMKRQNRKNAAAKVASNSTPGDGNDHVSGQEANA